MEKKLISLTDPEVSWLTKRAKRLGVSLAEVIRRIIDERIEEESRK